MLDVSCQPLAVPPPNTLTPLLSRISPPGGNMMLLLTNVQVLVTVEDPLTLPKAIVSPVIPIMSVTVLTLILLVDANVVAVPVDHTNVVTVYVPVEEILSMSLVISAMVILSKVPVTLPSMGSCAVITLNAPVLVLSSISEEVIAVTTSLF